jgi:hypothetical protein
MILPTDAPTRAQVERLLAARVSAIEEELADLVDDDEFWRFRARRLAVFVTPTGATTFRLPNQLVATVEARRLACASTRARSTRRCGRCSAGSTCR